MGSRSSQLAPPPHRQTKHNNMQRAESSSCKRHCLVCGSVLSRLGFCSVSSVVLFCLVYGSVLSRLWFCSVSSVVRFCLISSSVLWRWTSNNTDRHYYIIISNRRLSHGHNKPRARGSKQLVSWTSAASCLLCSVQMFTDVYTSAGCLIKVMFTLYHPSMEPALFA